jgi:hypothetical protein
MKALPFLRACLFLPVIFIMTVWAAKPEDYRSFDTLRAATARVPGWIEQKDKYLTFTAKELYYIIGKGAAEFDKQGLKKGVSVLLMKGNKVLEIYFNDFGKSSRAKSMVDIRKKLASNPKIVPQFNVTPAYCDEVPGGCVVNWAKANFYVEMTLSGYDASEEAVIDAAALINEICLVIPK